MGRREPPREAQIRYSRLAGITLEILLDDEQELPVHIKEAGNSKSRESRGKRHKRPSKTNNTAEVEAPAAIVEHDPPTLIMPAIFCSCKADIDNLEVFAGNEIPGTEVRHYHAELMKLSLLNGEEPQEPAAFELSSNTLDRLHDTHLREQLQMPRSARPSLTINGNRQSRRQRAAF